MLRLARGWGIDMARTADWHAQQYTKFEDERTRPVRDLVSAVPKVGVRVAIDIGCGPANSTQVLLEAFPEARVTGIDNSPDMLEAARKRLPGVDFQQADITTWDDPGPFDLILANAVLQWVPGHEELFPRLLGKLAAGGHLAVQMPDNLEEPAHTLMRQVAMAGPWAGKLKGAERTMRHRPEWYYDLLARHCGRVDLWRTTYYHVLADADAVVEWFKGSALRPFLSPLDADEQAQFLTRYRDAIALAYPAQADGKALLPFPRLFIVATRA
jgi:trans-aconitate 2-methyltransferase